MSKQELGGPVRGWPGKCIGTCGYKVSFLLLLMDCWSPCGPVVKKPPANAEDTGGVGLITGSGRSPGGGNGNPFQYSCLENPMDRGAWQGIVHGVTKSRMGLSD